MSIQQNFSQVLLDHITQLVSKLGSQSANEFEFRLGKYDLKDKRFTPGQNVLQFKSIIENLQRKKYTFTEEDSLDIAIHGQSGGVNLKNVRVTISGLDHIRQFCLNEQLEQFPKDTLKYIKKVKIDQPIDLIDYNLRGQFAQESDINSETYVVRFMRLLTTQQ